MSEAIPLHTKSLQNMEGRLLSAEILVEAPILWDHYSRSPPNVEEHDKIWTRPI